MFHKFLNEVIAFKLIQKSENYKHFFAELLDVVFYSQKHPFCGTLIIRYYKLGDLHEWTKNELKKLKKNLPSKEITDLLVDLARQIAQGFFH